MFRLNTSHLHKSSKIFVQAYRKGNGILPSIINPYGSDLYWTDFVKNYSADIRIQIKRSEVIAIDKPSQRCDPAKDEPSVSKCFEKQLIEKYLNCSLKRLWSTPVLNICNHRNWSASENDTILEKFVIVNGLDEREIFEMTGCMPGCSKSTIEISPEYQDNMIKQYKNEVRLLFYYNSGEYDLGEEYYIYNWGSFVADIGGYLGLLLGSSILSMYHMTTPLLIQQGKWLARKMEKRNTKNW